MTRAVTPDTSVKQLVCGVDNGLRRRIAAGPSNLCFAIARLGRLDLLVAARECGFPREMDALDNGCDSDDRTCTAAAAGGYLDTLKYAKSRGCSWDHHTAMQAAKNGHLDVLQFVRAGGCPWEGSTCCAVAVMGGHQEVLAWLRDEGCEFDHRCCALAAGGGHLDVVKYLRENGCEWTKTTCNGAAEGGHLEVLMWCRENGCEWETTTCAYAALGGHLDVLIWCREHGCEWDVQTCAAAAQGGDLDVLIWCREHGCEWTQDEIRPLAAKGGHLSVVAWALATAAMPGLKPASWRQRAAIFRANVREEQGNRLVRQHFIAAAGYGFLDVLRFARDNGCPCSSRASIEAAKEGRLDVLKYLWKEGCPMNGMVANYALMGGHADVVEWAQAQRFDRDEAEERAFRMLSEGELFYVETDDDQQTSTCHDHGHLGGVSLETITAARYPGQPAAKKGPSSIESRETASTSRTSSQDTQENDNNAWQQQPQQQQQHQGIGHRILASNPEPFFGGGGGRAANRVSLRQAQEWDFHKKLEDIEASERRDRQRSSSEPQLSSIRQLDLYRRPQPFQQRWDTVNEAVSSSSGWKTPASMAAPAPPPPVRAPRRGTSHRRCSAGYSHDPCADACAGLTTTFQRMWSSIFMGEEEQAHAVGTLRSRSDPRVNTMRRNYVSCTSTKTFESSPTYREALQRLGVDPDTSTFTMHIAGYRLVSTVLGLHAEYEVCVQGGGRVWRRWQRFSKFRTIAGCTQADTDAAAAWGRVLRAKPHFRCLNADYLALKCKLLEVFLQEVLFAMPTPAILIHFVSEK
eukprot:g9303.t1